MGPESPFLSRSCSNCTGSTCVGQIVKNYLQFIGKFENILPFVVVAGCELIIELASRAAFIP